MDTLFVILLVAMATVFSTDLLGVLISWTPLDTRIDAQWFTLPFAVLYHYLLSVGYPMIVVSSAASAFLALFISILIERISNSQIDIRRRR